MLAKLKPLEVEEEVAIEAAALDARLGHLPPARIVEKAAVELFPGEIAAVSSFGADSAVLLHMIAAVDRHLPVAFLDTGKHFGETLDYRDALAADLGLTNLRIIAPDAAALARAIGSTLRIAQHASVSRPCRLPSGSSRASAAASGAMIRRLVRPRSAASASR